MTRQLTASLEAGDALLSITVPVREDTGRWFQVARADVHGGGRVRSCVMIC